MNKLDTPESPGAREAYDRVVDDLVSAGAQAGKMFGMPCLKLAGPAGQKGAKAFAGYFAGDMVFKLRGDDHARAIALDGARLFDPMDMGRPMKEWVQVPPDHAAEWSGLATAAMKTVIQ